MSLINVPIEIASLTEAQIYEKFAQGKKYTGDLTPKQYLNNQLGLIVQNAIYDADVNLAKDNAIIGIIKPPVVVDGKPIVEGKVEVVENPIDINPL